MPRRSILSASERDSLLALPDAGDELIRNCTPNPARNTHSVLQSGIGHESPIKCRRECLEVLSHHRDAGFPVQQFADFFFSGRAHECGHRCTH